MKIFKMNYVPTIDADIFIIFLRKLIIISTFFSEETQNVPSNNEKRGKSKLCEDGKGNKNSILKKYLWKNFTFMYRLIWDKDADKVFPILSFFFGGVKRSFVYLHFV